MIQYFQYNIQPYAKVDTGQWKQLDGMYGGAISDTQVVSPKLTEIDA